MIRSQQLTIVEGERNGLGGGESRIKDYLLFPSLRGDASAE